MRDFVGEALIDSFNEEHINLVLQNDDYKKLVNWKYMGELVDSALEDCDSRKIKYKLKDMKSMILKAGVVPKKIKKEERGLAAGIMTNEEFHNQHAYAFAKDEIIDEEEEKEEKEEKEKNVQEAVKIDDSSDSDEVYDSDESMDEEDY